MFEEDRGEIKSNEPRRQLGEESKTSRTWTISALKDGIFDSAGFLVERATFQHPWYTIVKKIQKDANFSSVI